MVDVASIIIAVVAVIIAIVAIILIFVIPGPSGPTGPAGGVTGTALKVMGNATASNTQTVPDTANFSAGIPTIVTMKYTNPALLYNIVYNVNNGTFSLAVGSGGYYTVYTENSLSIALTQTTTGNARIDTDILINNQSVAKSSDVVYVDNTLLTQATLNMMSVMWQGTLKEGDNIVIQVTNNSLYNGTLTYNFPSLSRIYINGTNSHQ
jgi:hypothetical protein